MNGPAPRKTRSSLPERWDAMRIEPQGRVSHIPAALVVQTDARVALKRVEAGPLDR